MKRGIVYFYCYNANSRCESFSRKILQASQNSKLEPRNSILDSQKHRVLRIEFQVETVNLHLTGAVHRGCYTS